MTITEIHAILNRLLNEAEREQCEKRCYKTMDNYGYKWCVSADIIATLEWNACDYCIRLTRYEPITLYGIPVQIDYQAREKIELWRRIQED